MLTRAMKGGRKNLKRAAEGETPALHEGQSVMQVVSLRGSNLIEVMDAKGVKSLALFPAKFRKSMWIKRGSIQTNTLKLKHLLSKSLGYHHWSFVVVDESGREKAVESGNKVACIVSQVLFYKQVRVLQKSPEWPEIFNSTMLEDCNGDLHMHTHKEEENETYSSDDGLPPVEVNMNRVKPLELHSDSNSDSDS